MQAKLLHQQPPQLHARLHVHSSSMRLTCLLAFLQILPWYSFTVPGMLHFMALSASTGLALRCYFLCMFTDPGR
jgi:hypothetical protein